MYNVLVHAKGYRCVYVNKVCVTVCVLWLCASACTVLFVNGKP